MSSWDLEPDGWDLEPALPIGTVVLDPVEGERLALAGMALSELDRDWLRARYDEAILAAAMRHPVFCADQVWDHLQGIPQHKGMSSALGPALRRAAAAGIIRGTGRFRLSERTVAHRKPLPLWESLVTSC